MAISKEKILFIVNPISGVKSKKNLPSLIKTCLEKNNLPFEIKETTHGGHASELANQAVLDGYQFIVAAGGDGTINEVASELINTEAALGIIPLGSGNGLARHLKIPLNRIKAIENICEQQISIIDTCTFNDQAFFCTAGLGFDAHVSNEFAQKKKRGFKTYIRTTLSELKKYKPHEYNIDIDGKVITKKAFSITAANAAQFGNNAYISPESSIKDGKIDLCILRPFPKNRLLALSIQLFNKRIHRSKYMECIKGEHIVITRDNEDVTHLDGEPVVTQSKVEIRIIPKSLKVIGAGENI